MKKTKNKEPGNRKELFLLIIFSNKFNSECLKKVHPMERYVYVYLVLNKH